MTAFAINSGGVEYYDQKTGGSVNATLDTYTVSDGSTLVVRTDTYACANHSAAFGSLDNVAYSGIGGEVIIDPTYVRYVAYTGGSGNSPAFGATISQGGVSGVFLGVWANWQSEPIVPAAAIPASGFIKIGGVMGGAFSAGALTGIAATCSGADLQAWIEVRSGETATLTVPRVGEFSSVLAWFYLDDTTGVAGQIIPCPTTGSSSAVWAGAFIETAPGSNVFEKFCGVGAKPALSTTPTDSRAKFVWHTTSGLVLGSDGTNTVGYLPPAGCRVRIPAAILTNCTRTAGNGSGPRVVPNATVGTRAEFVTTSGGAIDLNGVVCQWYCNFTAAYSLNIEDSIVNDNISINRPTTRPSLANLIVAPTGTLSTMALALGTCLFGVDASDCLFARYWLDYSGLRVVSVAGVVGGIFTNCKSITLTARASPSSFSIFVSLCANTQLIDCTSIGARVEISASRNTYVSNLRFADGLTTTVTGADSGLCAIAVTTGSFGTKIDGGGSIPGVVNSHPYASWLFISASDEIRFFNFGTFSTPFDCGSVAAMGRLWTCSYQLACKGIYVKRCYAAGTRLGIWEMENTQSNIEIFDVYGDYADTVSVNTINTSIRNVGCTSPTTGIAAIYGIHWLSRLTSTTAGVFEIVCNEPSASTAGQCVVTSGSPKFNGSGSVLMTVSGQQIIFEAPNFLIGHTALANSALSLTGTNTGNLSYEFQYDIGAGYNGTWLTASSTSFTAVGAIDPAIGIKIKLRVTCVTANASNALTNIRIATVTTSTAQSTNLYPLDTITLTLTGLVSGSDVVVRAAGTGTILASVDSNAGTTWAYVYETPVAIDVDVIKPGYVPKSLLRNYTPSAQNSSLPVSQLLDRNYI